MSDIMRLRLVVVSDDTLKLQGNTLESVGGNLKVHSQQGSLEISASSSRPSRRGMWMYLAEKGRSESPAAR